MFPPWRSSFDAHIYEGRVLQVLLMRTADEPLAEVTLGVSVLAERCKKANGRSEFWVCIHVRVCVCFTACMEVYCNPFCTPSGGSAAFRKSDDVYPVFSGRYRHR